MAFSHSFSRAFAALCLGMPLLVLGSHRISLTAEPQFSVPPRVRTDISASVPLLASVTFAADRPVRAQLLLYDGRWTRLIYETDAFARNISLPVLGLRAATRHLLIVAIADELRNQTIWPFPLE